MMLAANMNQDNWWLHLACSWGSLKTMANQTKQPLRQYVEISAIIGYMDEGVQSMVANIHEFKEGTVA